MLYTHSGEGASNFFTWRPRAKRKLGGGYGNSFPSLISSVYFKEKLKYPSPAFLKASKNKYCVQC